MNVVSTENDWLTLSEYSSEYGVSVSTLRRRIKAKQIKFKLIQGKYFLPKHTQSPQNQAFAPVPAKKVLNSGNGSSHEDNTFQTARVLLDELKKAYLQSLQSKEDQIIQLKQQITDLKTLVMYLERENTRLNPKSF